MAWLLALLLVFSAAWPATAGSSGERLRAIAGIRLDGEQCYRVRDLFLEREEAKFYLTDGHLIFAHSFEGRDVAALFVASENEDVGEVLVIPPTQRERQSLARFIDETVLNAKFRAALMFFSDDTAATLRAALERSSSVQPDPKRGAELAARWSPTLRNVMEGVAPRILVDVGSEIDLKEGFFVAAVTGSRLGRFDVIVDPRRSEEVSAGQLVRRAGRDYYEIWTSFQGRSFLAANKHGPWPSARLENYRIESTLAEDLAMKVVARADFVSETAADRVFSFELSRRLRVTEVLIDGEPADWTQTNEAASGEARRRDNSLILVVLPEQPAIGDRRHMEFRYEGSVISDAGEGVYFVGDRGNWYPRPRQHFTSYELTFHYPAVLDLTATGELVEASEGDGVRTSVFHTSQPALIAGFNLGQFVSEVREVGDYRVEVHANKGVERALQPKQRPILVGGELPLRPRGGQRRRHSVVVNLGPAPTLSPAARIEQVTERSTETFEYFLDAFGPPALSRVVISPIPGYFGQGYSGLVYVSTLSYFGPTDAPLKSLPADQRTFYSELMRPHEIAHQWWGNLVIADRPSDVWLLEALATYSALMAYEQRQGREAADQVFRTYLEDLTRLNEDGEPIESAGAIVLGERLRSSAFPDAHRIIQYEKGAWIMHMLRGAMGDGQFLAFLRELASVYRYRALRVEDFRREAVRFVPEDYPDPTLREFFEQWVYGTGLPTIEVSYSQKKQGSRYHLTVSLLQRGVPEHFTVPTPIEIHTLPGRSLVKIVPTDGSRTEFSVVLRNPASKVVVDPQNVLLAVKK